jgi:cell wall assembly regulator SMI1
MNSITINFQAIVDKQNSMGYYFPSILNQPADTNLIEQTQQKLNLNFSKELIELYSFSNGTSRSENPLGMIGLIPIHIFMDLASAESYYSTSIQIKELFEVRDTGFRPGIKLFPFLEDSSGNCYWVDLNEDTDNYGKIFWTNTYPDSPAYKFNSLTSMFETIAQAYKTDIFFLDPDNYLDEDYDKWGVLAKIINPGIQFWDDYINGT